MSIPPPEVSVVIPTLRRSQLLVRALNSVLTQSYHQLEIIVVVDGPDEETVAMLDAIADPRVRYFVNPRSLTAAGARNFGVSQAHGEWIAFLDDDDEWLPQKLQRQMEVARRRGPALITALSRVVTPISTYIWPTVIYDNSRPLDEYLFDRQELFSGARYIQTSSYFMPRALFEASPFRLDTPHDDWDFVLRLSKQIGVPIETVPEVLVNVYVEEQRPSLSSVGAWTDRLAWVDSVHTMLTPRAYSGFCLCIVGPQAANQRAFEAFVPLLVHAFAKGAPRPWHLIIYFGFWIFPSNVRKRMRAVLTHRRAGPIFARPSSSRSPSSWVD